MDLSDEYKQRITTLEAELAGALKAVDDNWVSHQQLIAMRAERDAAAKAEREAMLADVLAAIRKHYGWSGEIVVSEVGHAAAIRARGETQGGTT